MEPKPLTNRGIEYGSAATPQGLEHRVPTFNPEKSLETRPEQERTVSDTNVAELATSSLPPVVVPQAQSTASDATATDDATDTPLVAADDDLIEKEWVDKAKKIIVSTKEDPYRREAEVSRLQVEYLRKRYGKELGASE